MKNCEGFPTLECPDHAPAAYDMLGYQLCEKCADNWRANDTRPSPVDALAERDARIAELEAELTKVHAAGDDLCDVAQWYASFYSDVQNTTPEYFELCGDLNAVDYLHTEAERIRAQWLAS